MSISELSETISVFDTAVATGKAYRFSTGRQFVSASGNYLALHFHTPDSGKHIHYAFSRIAKTGSEVEVTLVEGGTFSGGVAAPMWALNRRPEYKNILSGLTDVLYGVSPTCSITGGTSFPPYVIPGASQGNVKSGGSTEAGYIELEPNQNYTVKATSIEGNTYIDISSSIAIFD